eukprot:gnl/MRDRNA2_/MRDRNA2_86112_c0_seq2.p1 gnl/MRDRNA2_/MRDRNA2_86112_c0~~gnl/MRDRNA2_/MRDRNA2_86112_c0_seq2.p1  ORF type:complete len:538 (-),score=77.41 gnl/MRDRNA2_/MRDRNA2_86112_c0_seq2:270-1727(-)
MSRFGGRLILVCTFQIWLMIADEPEDAFQQGILLLASNLCIPLSLFVFLWFREKKFVNLLTAQNEASDDVAEHVDLTIESFSLIRDYWRQSWIAERYEKMITRLNNVMVKCAVYKIQNEFFAPLVSAILISAYIYVGGNGVISLAISLGTFLTNLKILKAIGEAWSAIYVVFLQINSVMPALLKITHLLNLPVETLAHMRQEKAEEQRSAKIMNSMLNSDSSTSAKSREPEALGHDEVDDLRIYARNIDFTYPYMLSRSGAALGFTGLYQCQFEATQGKLISFVGPRGEGKATMMKLLGGALLPDKGEFYIPPHLRVLHVTREPMFLNKSLLKNLTFGCLTDGDADAKLERVKKICSRLGLRDETIALLDHRKDKHSWTRILSATQKALLNIARALVSNPEVLVIQTPTVTMADTLARQVLLLLKEFVTKRGLEKDPGKWHLRRPRTCFFTASRAAGIEIADETYEVSERGIQLITEAPSHIAYL